MSASPRLAALRAILLGKMALQITAVMEHAENLDYVVPAAVDHEMPGTAHHHEVRPGSFTAEAQMIGENTRSEFRPLPRAHVR